MKNEKWELTIASDPANITEVEQFLNKVFAETDWDEEIQANIGIATTEIVNNAILHGNQSRTELDVYVCICLSEKDITDGVGKCQGKNTIYCGLF